MMDTPSKSSTAQLEYLSKEQFCKLCHISKATALRLIKSWLIPVIDTGKRTKHYLISTDDVNTYLKAFIEMCSIEGYLINKASMQHIIRKCPPLTAPRQEIYEAWREARRIAEKLLTVPPKNISFNRKKFAPYLEKLGSDRELEKTFLEFLQEKLRVS